jgi:hypothetical protein
MIHCWERATPVAHSSSTTFNEAPLEWRAPSNDPSVTEDGDTSPAELGRNAEKEEPTP